MKRFAVLLLSVGFVAAVAAAARYEDEKKDKDKDKDKGKAPPAANAELEKLSGTFAVTTFEENGKKFEGADLKKMKVVQKGAAWKFWYGDEITEGEDKVFPDKKPKEIDSTYTNGLNKGKTVKGIYEIDGDTIKYCWAAPTKDRPKAFGSKPDSGHTLMILKRVKEVPKKEEKKDDKKEEKKEEKKKDDKKDEKKKDEAKKEDKKQEKKKE
jgi:uncharacterized protein (TIGR03067 family)